MMPNMTVKYSLEYEVTPVDFSERLMVSVGVGGVVPLPLITENIPINKTKSVNIIFVFIESYVIVCRRLALGA